MTMRTVHGDGFELKLSWHGDYLRGQVNAPVDTFEISIAYWSAIAKECQERRAERVLVVENIIGQGNPLDMERLIDAIIAMGFRNIRVAFVDLLEPHLAAMEHGEILARERDITGRVFGDEGTALSWLRHGMS